MTHKMSLSLFLFFSFLFFFPIAINESIFVLMQTNSDVLSLLDWPKKHYIPIFIIYLFVFLLNKIIIIQGFRYIHTYRSYNCLQNKLNDLRLKAFFLLYFSVRIRQRYETPDVLLFISI